MEDGRAGQQHHCLFSFYTPQKKTKDQSVLRHRQLAALNYFDYESWEVGTEREGGVSGESLSTFLFYFFKVEINIQLVNSIVAFNTLLNANE